MLPGLPGDARLLVSPGLSGELSELPTKLRRGLVDGATGWFILGRPGALKGLVARFPGLPGDAGLLVSPGLSDELSESPTKLRRGFLNGATG